MIILSLFHVILLVTVLIIGIILLISTLLLCCRDYTKLSLYRNPDFFLMINNGPDLSKNIPHMRTDFIYLSSTQPFNKLYFEV